jgi:hypothetical protein
MAEVKPVEAQAQQTQLQTERKAGRTNIAEILKQFGLAGKEEAIAKAIAELTDEEKLYFVSYVYPWEDDSLATMLTLADRYGLGWLKDHCFNKLKLRCSVSGWRSNQLVAIAAEKRQEQSRFGFFARLFRREKEQKGMEPFE